MESNSSSSASWRVRLPRSHSAKGNRALTTVFGNGSIRLVGCSRLRIHLKLVGNTCGGMHGGTRNACGLFGLCRGEGKLLCYAL